MNSTVRTQIALYAHQQHVNKFGVCRLSGNSLSLMLWRSFEGLANTEILKFQTGKGFLDILATF